MYILYTLISFLCCAGIISPIKSFIILTFSLKKKLLNQQAAGITSSLQLFTLRAYFLDNNLVIIVKDG